LTDLVRALLQLHLRKVVLKGSLRLDNFGKGRWPGHSEITGNLTGIMVSRRKPMVIILKIGQELAIQHILEGGLLGNTVIEHG